MMPKLRQGREAWTWMWSPDGFSRTGFPTHSTCRMRDAFVSGGCAEPRAAAGGGKENTKAWEPQPHASPDYRVCILGVLHYRQKLCMNRLASWTTEATVCFSHHISWDLLQMEPRNTELFPRVKNSKGKTLYRLLQRFTPKHGLTEQLSLAFRYSRGQQDSSLEAWFLEVLSTTISHREPGYSAPSENKPSDANT